MSTITGQDHIESDVRLALSTQLLNTLNDGDLQFILYKVLGYVTNARSLCTLVLSILQRERVSQTIANDVIEAFHTYIYHNYPATTRSFLEQHKRGARGTVSKTIKRLLEIITGLEEQRKGLSRLREFTPPVSQSVYYHHVTQRRQHINIHKGADEASVFMRMAKKIPLKGGKAWIVPSSQGFHRSNLSTFSMQAEMPLGELLDPIGQRVRAMYWRQFKRGGEQ